MNKVILKKGKYIRIKGIVTMYSPYKKISGIWSGGSSWTEKNPLIRIGKCKHKPIKKERGYFRLIGEEKKKYYYCKGRIICQDCGYIIKLGKKMKTKEEPQETGG